MARAQVGIRAATRALALSACALLLAAPAAPASRTQETILMDDPRLVYGTDAEVERALETIAGLGVDRIRVSVFWKLVAPAADARERPQFDAADPAAYDHARWGRYDRVVTAARRHGLDVLLTITGPAPLWATGRPARTSIEPTYMPDPAAYGDFVRAVATRYSGWYVPPAPPPPPAEPPGLFGPPPSPPAVPAEPLPRVSAWSVWNEPNHPGWLTPQWSGRRRPFPAAPHHYRAMVDRAWDALHATHHGEDLILIGETAPRGWRGRSVISALRPLEFTRELYCLDARRQPFEGRAARARGCPATRAERRGFVESHPALFRATGWAHHAYGFAGRPSAARVDHPDDAQLNELPELVRTLDRALARYGQAHRLHVWITEYGYQTNPPDPHGVPPHVQAAYLNEADFIAYSNPRVASMAQFLLHDDVPWAHYPEGDRRRWATFQTGLMTADGQPKPSFESFRLPIHVVRAGKGRYRVFGQMRSAAGRGALSARIVFDGRRSVQAARAAHGRGFVDTVIRTRSRGSFRIVWTDPETGREQATRSVRVR